MLSREVLLWSWHRPARDLPYAPGVAKKKKKKEKKYILPLPQHGQTQRRFAKRKESESKDNIFYHFIDTKCQKDKTYGPIK